MAGDDTMKCDTIMCMGHAPGTEVLVRALKRRARVVECVREGVYRVQLGGMIATVRDDEIEPVAQKKKKRRTGEAPVSSATDDAGLSPFDVPARSIDLHGLSVDEARNRVAGYISRVLLAGFEQVEIIHGIGTGRLKAAVTADLRQIKAVKALEPHPSNPGVLLVYL